MGSAVNYSDSVRVNGATSYPPQDLRSALSQARIELDQLFSALAAGQFGAPFSEIVSVPYGEMYVDNGGEWVVDVSAGQEYGCSWLLSPPDVDYSAAYQFPVAAGNYVLELVGETGSDCGILTLDLLGIASQFVDFYSETTIKNVHQVSAMFTVPGSGLLPALFTVEDKNEDSSGYRVQLSRVIIRKV